MTSRAVLVTGCSSGIGRAIALRLARAGWPVYATARRPETLADLAHAGARVLPLDVTDEPSRVAAVRAVEAAEGAVGALVNNAGYGEYGPVETLDLDRVRAEFETNVFAAVRLAQLVLPGMRAQGAGRIVTMSSMGGRFTLPGGGAYHASKHAVEAFSDALRFEVAPFGVQVIVVEPGPVRSGFIDTAHPHAPAAGGPYTRFERAVQRRDRATYTRLGGRLAGSPEAVAAVIERALSAPRPRTRYRVTATARALLTARRLLPDRGWDALLRRRYGG